jgi:hypothetical protein
MQSPYYPTCLSIPSTPITAVAMSTPSTSTSTVDEVGPLTPSPLFPRDMASLFKLGPDDARALVRDYGLLEDIPEENGEAEVVRLNGSPTCSGTGSATPGGSPDVERMPEANVTRERDLSRFMAHIGVSSDCLILCLDLLDCYVKVPFRMVPQQSSRRDRTQLPPLIINC